VITPGIARRATPRKRRLLTLELAVGDLLGRLVVRLFERQERLMAFRVGGFGRRVRADVAGNGREAVEMVKMLSYDVIFMDCQMPDMNGFEAAQEIRRQQKASHSVAIIAMTADATVDCREQCAAAGMNDFIAKPVKLEDLKTALDRAVPPVSSGSVA
jgi:CheY-like chemotaxis protein